MTQNILYLSYDGMTDPLGQSQVLPYLCGLSQKGYRFTLISCEKPERFHAHQHTIQAICEKYHIDWKPMVYHKSPPILSTVWDVYTMYQNAKKEHHEKQFKGVHCRGYISALVGLSLKTNFQIPFLFDMRGFWADEKRDAGAWKKGSWMYDRVYNYFKTKEKAFIQESSHIISLTHRGKKEMLSWSPSVSESKISVIPCCVETQHFDATPIPSDTIQAFRTSLGIAPQTFLWCYLGSIGTWYMLDEMMDFFVVWIQKNPESKLLFITHDEHARIEKAATQRGIANRILYQGASRQELPLWIAACQASLFFIRSTYSKMSSSPTKQGELMAMGIPIVCNAGVGDTDKIVLDYQSGVLVDAFDPQTYEKAIENFKNTSFDASSIRKGAQDYFELEKGVASYLEIYKNIF